MMATTTPADLVRPLAQRLGFNDVVATTYGVNADGTYDGSIVGPFVWANGKLEAVRAWAERHDIDMAESYAYSDSVHDTPLLSSVGHPVAVNPDPRMLVIALARRWPVVHLDVPPGVPKLPCSDLEPQQLALAFTRPSSFPFARWDIDGVHQIPAAGPAILVANHRSYFDATAVAMVVAQSGRTVRFLGKKEVFDALIVGQLAKAMGGIRVERLRLGRAAPPCRRSARGRSDGGAHARGHDPAGEAFFDPELKGRWGAARLAGMTEAHR